MKLFVTKDYPTKEMVVAAPTKETQAILEKLYDNQQKEDEFQQKEYGSTKITLPVIGEPTENITIKQAKEIEKLDRATRGMPIEQREAIFNEYYQLFLKINLSKFRLNSNT